MATVNITVVNDADFERVFQYRTTDGVPIDITGGTMVMMLRRNAQDDVALLRLAHDSGEFETLDGINGLFRLLIKQEDLERLGLGEYAQSNVMTLGARKRSIWTGMFTNNPGPSR